MKEPINVTSNIKSIEPINFCGKPVMWKMEIDGLFYPPFEIPPIEGSHNFNNCKNCQTTLKSITKTLTDKFNGSEKKRAFPFCCSLHKNLVTRPEFTRAFYVKVPEFVAQKVVYTNAYIISFHNAPNWYKDITDYIEWIIDSFGAMPNNCGEPLYLSDYFFYVVDLLNKYEGLPEEKRIVLIEYIDKYRNPSKQKNTDLNILINTYQKWFKLFPFEISFFKHLKERFETRLPLFYGKPEINQFSEKAKLTIHTKKTLTNLLLQITDSILTKINTLVLYEQGQLTEPNKIELELLVAERKVKLKKGYKTKRKDEKRSYQKMLNEWFKDEKKFIKEITPILKAIPSTENEGNNSTNNKADGEQNNRTKELITKFIHEIDANKGWEYSFHSESDYNTITDLLVKFFEQKPYEITGVSIKLRKGSKTRFAKMLGNLYNELADSTLSKNEEYFRLIKTIEDYKDKTKDELYKDITRP